MQALSKQMDIIPCFAYLLCFKGLIKANVIGQSSHSNRKLAYGFQVYWFFMGSLDECIHPPVCSFG